MRTTGLQSCQAAFPGAIASQECATTEGFCFYLAGGNAGVPRGGKGGVVRLPPISAFPGLRLTQSMGSTRL